MIGLLTAFFLYYGDAHWGWWIGWVLIELNDFVRAWKSV